MPMFNATFNDTDNKDDDVDVDINYDDDDDDDRYGVLQSVRQYFTFGIQ